MRLTLSSIEKRDFVFLVSCITLNLDKKKKKKKERTTRLQFDFETTILVLWAQLFLC